MTTKGDNHEPGAEQPYTVRATKIAAGHYLLSCRCGWRFRMLSVVADMKDAARHHEATHASDPFAGIVDVETNDGWDT